MRQPPHPAPCLFLPQGKEHRQLQLVIAVMGRRLDHQAVYGLNDICPRPGDSQAGKSHQIGEDRHVGHHGVLLRQLFRPSAEFVLLRQHTDMGRPHREAGGLCAHACAKAEEIILRELIYEEDAV